MNHHDRLSDHFSRHVPADLDAFNADAPEELDLGFSIDQNVIRGDTARNFSGVIDRDRSAAMKIATQLALDQGRATGHITAAQVTFGSDMDFTVRPNGAAEAGGDFIIAQIKMRAALRTRGRGGRGNYFLLRMTLETFDR